MRLLCSHAGVNPKVILEDDDKPTPRNQFYKIELEYQRLKRNQDVNKQATSRARTSYKKNRFITSTT